MTKFPALIFAKIYHQNRWESTESRSGPGSSLEQTEAVRIALPLSIKELGCTSILDIPCGDFYWMNMINLDIRYIGGDIVDDLITENKRKYASSNREFVRLDIISGRLPKLI